MARLAQLCSLKNHCIRRNMESTVVTTSDGTTLAGTNVSFDSIFHQSQIPKLRFWVQQVLQVLPWGPIGIAILVRHTPVA